MKSTQRRASPFAPSLRLRAASALAIATALCAGEAAADPGDPSYGRFEGDLAVAAATGIAVGPRSSRGGVDLRVRYLSTAGFFATYEAGPLFGERADPRQVIAFGTELRPLFFGRWARGLHFDSPRLDMLVDSLAIELGAVFVQPEGARFGARPGLQAGLGLELPIFTRATGPFLALHGGVRWSAAALSGGPLSGPSDRALYAMIALGWQQLFGGNVVDAGDRRSTARR